MSKHTPQPPWPVAAQPSPKPPFRWVAVRYVDGDLNQLLDFAKMAIRREARAAGQVVKEFVKSGSYPEKTETFVSHVDKVSGNPVYGSRLHCVIYLVAVCENAPPQKWVRMTAGSGPAAVEVMTTQDGKVLKVEEYHQEDSAFVAKGFAERALEECAGP